MWCVTTAVESSPSPKRLPVDTTRRRDVRGRDQWSAVLALLLPCYVLSYRCAARVCEEKLANSPNSRKVF